MNAPALIERLALQAPVLAGLAAGVADEQARWKPAPGKWSILEVFGHLLDEEREDFRARLDLTLHRPEGELLAAWVAHDLLHMRQLARLHYDHAAEIAAPHGLDYAGGW